MIITHTKLIRKDNKKYDPLTFLKYYFNWANEPSNHKSRKFLYDGDFVSRSKSNRYKVFQKSLSCHICGIKGQFFVKEKDPVNTDAPWHMNLYAIDQFGNEVLMTRDHIICKQDSNSSEGVKNLKTCCKICNEARGNIPFSELFKPDNVKKLRHVRRTIYQHYRYLEIKNKQNNNLTKQPNLTEQSNMAI